MKNQKGEIGIGGAIGIFVLCVVALFALDWAGEYYGLVKFGFFGPRNEAVRRQVYEQTKSYKQGSVQRLNTLCTQVGETDEGHKPMLYDVIKQEFAEWDTDDVPAYLRSCLTTARAK